MFMRFCGLGVGHRLTWELTRQFRDDFMAAYKINVMVEEEEVEEVSDNPEDGDEDNESHWEDESDSDISENHLELDDGDGVVDSEGEEDFGYDNF
jgi:hypothetical protein